MQTNTLFLLNKIFALPQADVPGMLGSTMFNWRKFLSNQLRRAGDGSISISPHFEKAQSLIMDWSVRTGILTKDSVAYVKSQKAEFAKLPAYSLAKVSEKEVISAAKLIAWLFERDNKLDSRKETISTSPEAIVAKDKRFRQILLNSLEGDPISFSERALQDLFLDISHATIEENRSLVKKFDQYFQSNEKEARYRMQKKQPSINTYQEYRVYNSAVQVYEEFMGIVQNHKLSEEERENIEYIRAMNLAALIVGIHNDLFSVGKESEEEYPENLVLLKMGAKGISFRSAIGEVINEVNGMISDFNDLSADLLLGNPHYAESIERMKNLIDGNIVWSEETDRYKGLPSKFLAELQS